ncbi:hypothetical protein N9N97_01525 [Rickettsiaceae bacterium]|nr:hypothetical protein [Rickettsiaceae bacterium]
MQIQRGGLNDDEHGWTEGYATGSDLTGAVYLNCEYTILSGEYKGRKIWSTIGLYSSKNDNIWGDIGRSFIRSILNSRSGFTDKDDSPEATVARQIESFAELDGCEFVARVDVENDEAYGKKNVIKAAITPEHKQYNAAMDKASVKLMDWTV